jgi:hypothetical protein
LGRKIPKYFEKGKIMPAVARIGDRGIPHCSGFTLVTGSSDVFVNGIIRADRLDIGISGASDFKGAVMVKELVLSQSGASDAEISGEAVKFRADISGACNLKAYGLTAETAEISASGASNARVNVTRQLDAKASGASDLYYKGAPANTNFDSKGASSVRKVER